MKRIAWVAVVLAGASAGPAHAQQAPEGDAGAPRVYDGPTIELGVRPDASRWPSACSFRRPICVHAQSARAPVLEALADTERAWDAATLALELPAPLASYETGRFDLYLAESSAEEDTFAGERVPLAGFDAATSFAVVDPRLRGCSLEAAITRQLLRAVVWRVAPATDRATAIATTAALAELVTPCAMGSDTWAIAKAQALPERAIVGALDDSQARGMALFHAWIDEAYARTPGATIRAGWALTPSRTPLEASSWSHEPDTFDVLRESFRGALFDRSTLDDALSEFGVGRAFVGARSDALHFPESATLGRACDVGIAWDVPWPKSPRSLASPIGVAPTGSSYVRISRKDAPASASLRIEARWEQRTRFRWVAVKVDAKGHEIGRQPVAAVPNAESAALTLGDLDATDSVLLVATNTGPIGDKLDPDVDVWEPHGWVLSIAAE